MKTNDEETRMVMVNSDRSQIYLNMQFIGGELKIPVNKNEKVKDFCKKTNDFIGELFAIKGVEEVFKKYGASYERKESK